MSRSPLAELPLRSWGGIAVTGPDAHGHRVANGWWGHVWDEPAEGVVFFARFKDPLTRASDRLRAVSTFFDAPDAADRVRDLPFSQVSSIDIIAFLREGRWP